MKDKLLFGIIPALAVGVIGGFIIWNITSQFNSKIYSLEERTNILESAKRYQTQPVQLVATLEPLTTKNISFSWQEKLGKPTAVLIGDIQGEGGFAELIISVARISNDGGLLYVHNSSAERTWTADFKIELVALYE